MFLPLYFTVSGLKTNVGAIQTVRGRQSVSHTNHTHSRTHSDERTHVCLCVCVCVYACVCLCVGLVMPRGKQFTLMVVERSEDIVQIVSVCVCV